MANFKDAVELQLKQLNFCPECGINGFAQHSNKLSCKNCGLSLYLNVAATASLILKVGDQVLMTQRGREPARDKYDFPGGFVEPDESLEQGLEREIAEELNYHPAGYQYFSSSPNRYPYAGIDYNLCDAYFLLELTAKPELIASDDVKDFAWKPLEEIKRSDIAFDSVWHIIEKLGTTQT